MKLSALIGTGLLSLRRPCTMRNGALLLLGSGGVAWTAYSLRGRVQAVKSIPVHTAHSAPPRTNAESLMSRLQEVFETYAPSYLPRSNKVNLEVYYRSDAYKQHAKTARIYYDAEQIGTDDALRIIFQREPTNIAMGERQYHQQKLHSLFGYERGVYRDPSRRKEDGSVFSDLPNTATVYSETFLWNPPGSNKRIEIACLSLPAPALDTSAQPHFKYYVDKDGLNQSKYDKEMKFLFDCVKQVIIDHKDSAFEGRGIQRVVLSKFGQGAFLASLSQEDRVKANDSFKRHLETFLQEIQQVDPQIKVVMSLYQCAESSFGVESIVGDIVKTAEENDLIINAWDPHSAPGNGNDNDRSFDGAMGRSSGILLTQTSWLNDYLKHTETCVAVTT